MLINAPLSQLPRSKGAEQQDRRRRGRATSQHAAPISLSRLQVQWPAGPARRARTGPDFVWWRRRERNHWGGLLWCIDFSCAAGRGIARANHFALINKPNAEQRQGISLLHAHYPIGCVCYGRDGRRAPRAVGLHKRGAGAFDRCVRGWWWGCIH